MKNAIARLVTASSIFVVAAANPAQAGSGDVAAGLIGGFAAGAIVGLAMIAREGASARKKGIPFGPFLAQGGVVGLLVGD